MATFTGEEVTGTRDAGSGTKGRFVVWVGAVAAEDAGKYLHRARDTGLPGVQYVTWRGTNPNTPYPGVPAGTLTDHTSTLLR